MDRHWWKETVFYQIYPRSFQDSNGDGVGDLRGILEHIDYLVELGVGAIWLGPVCTSPNDDMGYDISNYRDILAEFGTLADWESLRDALHANGIKLLVDLVVNHTSDEHPWFIESRASKDSPKRDYYIWREGRNGGEPNNWSSFFTPSAWEYDVETGEYYLHLFSRKQPDLNWHNPAVRAEVFNMMTWWLDLGADGFRMDVINLLCKTEGFPDAAGARDRNGYVFPCEHIANIPPVHEYLREMARTVYVDREIFTVGECLFMDVEEGLRYTAGEERELHATFSFAHIDLDGMPEGKWYYRCWRLPELKKVLAEWQYGMERGWLGLFWSNQDQPRALSRFGTAGVYRERCAKMLGTVLHHLRGTPFVYQGEELGMVNVPFNDVSQLRDVESLNFVDSCLRTGADETWMWDALHRKARDNARTPMPWTAGKNGGFTDGMPWMMLNPDYPEINVAAARADPDSVYHFYRRLIALRREHPIMCYGRFELLWPEDEDIFAFLRELDGERWLIATNFTPQYCRRPWPADLPAAETLILDNVSGAGCTEDGVLRLAPYEAAVFRLKLGKRVAG